jgi:hypothetical protein
LLTISPLHLLHVRNVTVRNSRNVELLTSSTLPQTIRLVQMLSKNGLTTLSL